MTRNVHNGHLNPHAINKPFARWIAMYRGGVVRVFAKQFAITLG